MLQVSRVSNLFGRIKVGDVIGAVDGEIISNDGRVSRAGGSPIDFRIAVTLKLVGEPITCVRGGGGCFTVLHCAAHWAYFKEDTNTRTRPPHTRHPCMRGFAPSCHLSGCTMLLPRCCRCRCRRWRFTVGVGGCWKPWRCLGRYTVLRQGKRLEVACAGEDPARLTPLKWFGPTSYVIFAGLVLCPLHEHWDRTINSGNNAYYRTLQTEDAWLGAGMRHTSEGQQVRACGGPRPCF